MKYRFEVTYETPEFIIINNFMEKLDLGEGRVWFTHVFEATTHRDYEETEKIKDAMKACMESEGYKVHYIKGGTWS